MGQGAGKCLPEDRGEAGGEAGVHHLGLKNRNAGKKSMWCAFFSQRKKI